MLLEVERHTEGIARKFKHFCHQAVTESGDTRDAVSDLNDSPHIRDFGTELSVFDLALQRIDDEIFGCHKRLIFDCKLAFMTLSPCLTMTPPSSSGRTIRVASALMPSEA